MNEKYSIYSFTQDVILTDQNNAFNPKNERPRFKGREIKLGRD